MNKVNIAIEEESNKNTHEISLSITPIPKSEKNEDIVQKRNSLPITDDRSQNNDPENSPSIEPLLKIKEVDQIIEIPQEN